jgi:hypothetical protein
MIASHMNFKQGYMARCVLSSENDDRAGCARDSCDMKSCHDISQSGREE